MLYYYPFIKYANVESGPVMSQVDDIVTQIYKDPILSAAFGAGVGAGLEALMSPDKTNYFRGLLLGAATGLGTHAFYSQTDPYIRQFAGQYTPLVEVGGQALLQLLLTQLFK